MQIRSFQYRLIIILYLQLLSYSGFSQRKILLIPHTIQLSVDEDYLNYRGKGTDRYYTAGIFLSFYFQKTSDFRNAASGVKTELPLYNITLSQIMFTPNNISEPGFQTGDYPYSGALYLTYGKTVRTSKNEITNNYSIGMVGPKSFAGETQIFAHKLIKYTRPEGWGTQIKSELLLNYGYKNEHTVYQYHDFLDVKTQTELNVGTVHINTTIGALLRIGKLNINSHDIDEQGPLNSSTAKPKLFFFINPSISIIGYNGLLQGGISTRNKKLNRNTYTIADQEISRVISKLSFGINYQGKKVGISYTQYIQSREFATAKHHEYGNVTLNIYLNK